MEIKTAVRYYCSPIRMGKMEKMMLYVDEDMKVLDML